MLKENQVSIGPSSHVFSVEQLNGQIKQILENQVGLVWVQGEISNFKPHSSGHFYFSLKDSKSQITAVMFRGYNSRLKFKPTDGMEVIVRGRLSVYEPRGNYQIICESMEAVGAGALQKAFEQLKEKLKGEGLFLKERKKPIPRFPQHIAVVTSPTGAAIQDILNILNRRVSNLEITIVPTIVQGIDAAPLLCEAFKKASALPGIDVIIIGRGGGSIEDMWCFNDEALARLISDCKVPVISAVGHEIDFTICDFVSDLRAPTPSAAAELVAQSTANLLQEIKGQQKLLLVNFDRLVKNLISRWTFAKSHLLDPRRKLQDYTLRNDDLRNRLELGMSHYFSKRQFQIEILKQKLISPIQVINRRRSDISHLSSRLSRDIFNFIDKKKFSLQNAMLVLDSLSPLRVVERGYSIVTKGDVVIRNNKQTDIGDLISIRLSSGQLLARVEKSEL